MQVSDALSNQCQIGDDQDRLDVVRSALMSKDEAEDLAQLYRLLGDATRVRLLSALVEAGELSVGALADVVQTSETKVSQGLRLLRSAGVVKNRRAGRLVYYRLNDSHVRLMLGLSLEHLNLTADVRRSLVGSVERISIAPGNEQALDVVDNVEAVAGLGLVGDRHAGNVARQVSIQSRSEFHVAAKRLGRPILTDQTRRNITIDTGELPRERGQRLFFGEVELEVFSDAPPCGAMTTIIGKGARAALKRVAGIHCRVITGGTIQVGDDLVLGRGPLTE